jgi:hypothetical protein
MPQDHEFGSTRVVGLPRSPQGEEQWSGVGRVQVRRATAAAILASVAVSATLT